MVLPKRVIIADEDITVSIDYEDINFNIEVILSEPYKEPQPEPEIPEPDIPYKIIKGVPDLGDNVIFKQNKKTHLGVITGLELGPNDEQGYQIMNSDGQQFFILTKNVEKIQWTDEKNIMTEKEIKQKKFDQKNK